MKKLILILCCTASLMIGGTAIAQKKVATPKTAAALKTEKQKQANIQVSLHAKPEFASKVLKKFPVNSHFVAIFRKGHWVKVGVRKDGTVGWLNLEQYHQAQQRFYRAYFHPKTETIIMRTVDKDPKKTEIIIYRNGKKLSDKEAKKMYHQIRKEQQRQWQEMQRFNRDMKHMFMDSFAWPSMMMPGMVIISNNK